MGEVLNGGASIYRLFVIGNMNRWVRGRVKEDIIRVPGENDNVKRMVDFYAEVRL